jgi:hypothetical protein
MSNSSTNERPKSRAARSTWYASIIEGQERDGISVVEAARAAGITAVTLYRWKKLLSSDHSPTATQGLVGSRPPSHPSPSLAAHFALNAVPSTPCSPPRTNGLPPTPPKLPLWSSYPHLTASPQGRRRSRWKTKDSRLHQYAPVFPAADPANADHG